MQQITNTRQYIKFKVLSAVFCTALVAIDLRRSIRSSCGKSEGGGRERRQRQEFDTVVYSIAKPRKSARTRHGASAVHAPRYVFAWRKCEEIVQLKLITLQNITKCNKLQIRDKTTN